MQGLLSDSGSKVASVVNGPIVFDRLEGIARVIKPAPVRAAAAVASSAAPLYLLEPATNKALPNVPLWLFSGLSGTKDTAHLFVMRFKLISSSRFEGIPMSIICNLPMNFAAGSLYSPVLGLPKTKVKSLFNVAGSADPVSASMPEGTSTEMIFNSGWMFLAEATWLKISLINPIKGLEFPIPKTESITILLEFSKVEKSGMGFWLNTSIINVPCRATRALFGSSPGRLAKIATTTR